MKVGVTGHQERKGIQWSWVERTIHDELIKVAKVDKALSSLAAGTDQIFAKVAISLQIPVVAVLPIEGYERFFKGLALADYWKLLSQCELLQLTWTGNPDRSFLEAGKFIVDACDLLFAVWDGDIAAGLGGTGDVVSYAQQSHRPIIHIDPCTELVYKI